jgi:hypothetical protein
MNLKKEEAARLGRLYLSLWRQLDLLLGEDKWLDVEATDPSNLRSFVERNMGELKNLLDDANLLERVENDYRHTQEIVDKLPPGNAISQQERAEWVGFKDYLRDQGLRYDDAADGKLRSSAAGAAGD